MELKSKFLFQKGLQVTNVFQPEHLERFEPDSVLRFDGSEDPDVAQGIPTRDHVCGCCIDYFEIIQLQFLQDNLLQSIRNHRGTITSI
jgi:hypothetical protein